MVALLVQQKLAGRSLNSICIESPAVQHLSIYFSNEHCINFHTHQTVNEVLAREDSTYCLV